MQYFASASNPVDNGVNTTTPTVITPPGSMTTGDLVIVFTQAKAASITITVSNAGGQSWTSLTQQSTTSCSTRIFWCVYNGTWSANPSFAFSGTPVLCSAIMHVFNPSKASGNTWTADVAEAYTTHTGGSAITLTGITTAAAALGIAAWASIDDNTWTLDGGSSWFVLGGAQYRNNGTSTTDDSCTFAYIIKPQGGATGNVAKTQSALGPDAGGKHILSFKERPIIQLVSTTMPTSTAVNRKVTLKRALATSDTFTTAIARKVAKKVALSVSATFTTAVNAVWEAGSTAYYVAVATVMNTSTAVARLLGLHRELTTNASTSTAIDRKIAVSCVVSTNATTSTAVGVRAAFKRALSVATSAWTTAVVAVWTPAPVIYYVAVDTIMTTSTAIARMFAGNRALSTSMVTATAIDRKIAVKRALSTTLVGVGAVSRKLGGGVGSTLKIIIGWFNG